MTDVIELRPEGLYCAAGDFHIDPWRPVPRAVITHAHADHARSGHGRYWAAAPGEGLLRLRLGRELDLNAVPYMEPVRFGSAQVSFHPAGHVLGSAQIRIKTDDGVWVVSGDYKRDPDPTCAAFEPVRCDTFITEATFALPVYRWPDPAQVMAEIDAWWRECAAAGRPAVLFCYALGKAQRVLAGLLAHRSETVYLHGAMTPLVAAYRDAGVTLVPTEPVSDQANDFDWRGRLVLAPPGAGGTPWMRRFRNPATGFVSGWMRIRGNRRRRGYDRGFVLSDHADWDGLLRSIHETGARRVLATHGHSDALVRVLREQGLSAGELGTAFEGEAEA
jgi:putative mRNA 3-end processing factor